MQSHLALNNCNAYDQVLERLGKPFERSQESGQRCKAAKGLPILCQEPPQVR